MTSSLINFPVLCITNLFIVYKLMLKLSINLSWYNMHEITKKNNSSVGICICIFLTKAVGSKVSTQWLTRLHFPQLR